ncbi:MAG TPA: class I SAM-dependent methyltransferase [Candidatus Tectomicrobia bacterium]|nr:class I SAM-dependent methyltransferase [Candidatus Tectomicrobia bacterium]
MRTKEFYERYWQTDGAPPQRDPTTAEREAHLADALRALSGTGGPGNFHVLDAGCGDATFMAFLQGLGFRVSGIELSSAAAARARRRCPNANIQVGSLEDPLPFVDAAFDAIWCTEVLEHLFDVHAALTEFNRVLNEKGTLLLTTPYHGLVKNLAIVLIGFDQHFNPEISHIRFFTRPTLERCLRRAGFVPVAWKGVGRTWPLWKSFFVVARKQGPVAPPPDIVG